MVVLVRAVVLVRVANHAFESKSLLGGYEAAGSLVCKYLYLFTLLCLDFSIWWHQYSWNVVLIVEASKWFCLHCSALITNEKAMWENNISLSGWCWLGLLQLAAFLEIVHSAMGMHYILCSYLRPLYVIIYLKMWVESRTESVVCNYKLIGVQPRF